MFKDYAIQCKRLAIFPSEHSAAYLTLGLFNEIGEVAGALKKQLRGDELAHREHLLLELGDVCWYAVVLFVQQFGIEELPTEEVFFSWCDSPKGQGTLLHELEKLASCIRTSNFSSKLPTKKALLQVFIQVHRLAVLLNSSIKEVFKLNLEKLQKRHRPPTPDFGTVPPSIAMGAVDNLQKTLGIRVSIAADSMNTKTGNRITTFHIQGLWKILLQELNRHRALSVCDGSSRAVPVSKMLKQVWKEPFVPGHWGKNKPGMQATEELTGWKRCLASWGWRAARYPSLAVCWLLQLLGLHKQTANRLLEPWMRVDRVMTGTEWRNFFALRDNALAQPELYRVAEVMHLLYDSNLPKPLSPGEWHLPLVTEDEKSWVGLDNLLAVSAARCARASTLKSTEILNIEKDQALVEKLSSADPQHLSPFEHQAKALSHRSRSGNFVGWEQQRKSFENESGGDYL